MRKTLANYYLFLSFIFIFLVIVFITILSHSSQQTILESTSEDIKNNIIKNYKDELKNRIEIIEQLIYQKEEVVREELKQEIQSRVYEAHRVATTIYEKYKKIKSKEEIQELIKASLREIRFNEGRGYFFIDDSKGNCILYPIRAEIEGTNIINFQDVTQKYVIKNFINLATLDKEGFSSYFTYKYKYEKDAKRYEKIAFVKLFEPYNWIIGTGEYLDDAQNELKIDIARVINTLRVANQTSYVNVFEVHDFQGGEEFATMVVNPNRKDIYGKKISSHVTDIDGREYRQEALELLNKDGDGFITYKYKKINSQEVSQKLTYVKKLKLWNWVLSTGIHLDDVDALVKANAQKLQDIKNENNKTTWMFLSVLFIILVLSVLGVSRKIAFESGKIIGFFKKAVFRKEQIESESFIIEEFKSLATYANEMVKTINQEQEKLEELNKHLESNIKDKTMELESLNHYLQVKNRELETNYYTDSLTGLYNRNKFHDDSIVFDDITAVILDIDDFKNINDFYGLKAGDSLLQSVAIMLKEFAEKEGAYAYRLSSDEFLVCFDKTWHESILEKIKEVVQIISSKSFFFEGNKLSLSLTFAIAHGKVNVLEKTDLALNFAKSNKLSFAIFNENNPHMNTHKHKIYWREKIQWAIDNSLIEPFFQPIVDISDKHSKKYESLMRLRDGDEIIPPHLFLPVSKETKQYQHLTCIMIEKTFKVFKEEDAEFSLNISMEDIKNSETKSFLIKKIEECKIGHKLILEVLESEDITINSTFFDFVEEVRGLGVRFAIDDFGSGYSNFGVLIKLSPKFLKIDGALVKDIVENEKSYNIVKTIVNFSKQIGATPIAEFVENEQIVKTLQKFDIKLMQGYHFSPPRQHL